MKTAIIGKKVGMTQIFDEAGLETAGLIMRVRQGVGEPNRIYVLIPGKEGATLA